SYHGQVLFPVINNPPDTAIGGDLQTPVDWFDPWVLQRFRKDPGNWMIRAPNPHGARTVDFESTSMFPGHPDAVNWLGTDERGRDMVAELLYGFRVSVLFGLALTAIGTLIGIVAG